MKEVIGRGPAPELDNSRYLGRESRMSGNYTFRSTGLKAIVSQVRFDINCTIQKKELHIQYH